jgi:hypothetical protein
MTSAPCFVLPIWIFPAPTDATGFGLASFEVLPKTDLFPKVQMCRTNEVQQLFSEFLNHLGASQYCEDLTDSSHA